MADKKIVLDQYEQDIEDNFELCPIAKNEDELKKEMMTAAREYLKATKALKIEIPQYDFESIQFKASQAGLTCPAYIGMLVHRDVMSL